MHRILIPILLLAVSCASPPVEPGSPDEVGELMRALRSPPPAEMPSEEWPENRLAALGDAALPSLSAALGDSADPAFRDRAARSLGRMWATTGNVSAVEAYVTAIRSTTRDLDARGLLAHAHRFPDSERRVFTILDAALRAMRVINPEMVTAAAAMTDVEAVETMMKVVGRNPDAATSPERAIALRYIGRAARRDRREAIEFLTTCAQTSNADIIERSSAELSLLAGRITPRNWRAWWFDHGAQTRWDWLLQTFPSVGGRPFDPTDRGHVGELVARIPMDHDAEPEMWFLEQVLGRRFGYVSPRDAFDPESDPAALVESNRRALATVRDWWRENSPYLYYNTATARFELSEEGRRIGVPVDPLTGKPGR